MERDNFNNPSNIHGYENVFNRVYINRNFCKTSQSHRESNYSVIQPHINPHFHKNNIISSETKIIHNIANPSTSNSNTSKIYVNRKILGVGHNIKQENKTSVTNILPIPKNLSRNKFTKINTPKIEIYSNNTNSKNTSINCNSQKLKMGNPDKSLENSKLRLCTKSKFCLSNIDKRYQSTVINKHLTNLPDQKKVDVIRSRKKINKKLNTSIPILKRNLNRSNLTMTSAKNIVYIGREKFISNGNVLRKLQLGTTSHINRKIIKQICINGKTFVRKSDNLFVGCKNVSSKTLKKNNVHCPVFRRLGVCIKHQKGKCIFVHDRKHVTICRKFIAGACKLEGCFLSHDISLEKMPTCKFYLEGCCSRDDCPYLHVKINEDSQICTQFLQGYCVAGKDCDSMHINICPDFYKSSKCNKPKCLYPHKLTKSKMTELSNTETSLPCPIEKVITDDHYNSKIKNISTHSHNDDTKRYFLKNVTKESTIEVSEISDPPDTDNKLDNINYLPLSNRPKLGILPSYIAL